MLPTLRDGRGLDALGERTWSALPEAERAARYDKIAAGYDRLVSSNLYNRVVWGVPRARYETCFEAAFAAAGAGPLLDAGCGSAVLTAPVYQRVPVQAVLLDLSRGMLELAATRVPALPLVQADLRELPFQDATFAAALHFGIAHVLDDPAPVLAELARVVRPGGEVHVACLVRSGRWLGDAWLRLLQASGEVAPARTAEQVVALLEPYGEVRASAEGSWVFAVLTVR